MMIQLLRINVSNLCNFKVTTAFSLKIQKKCHEINIKLAGLKRSVSTYDGQPPASELDEEVDSLDEDLQSLSADTYILPSQGHRVFVIQPDVRVLSRRNKYTTPQLQLEEACALTETLPNWTVVDSAIYTLKQIHKQTVYGTGNVQIMKDRIHKGPDVTAVFMSIDMLTGLQLATLQKQWKVPIYDRYTMVLQIFKIRARTSEAKLQVALAEIPYMRSRMYGVHRGLLDQQRGSLAKVGGSGETSRELKERMLQEREIKIKKTLAKLKKNRELLKNEQKRREIPIVAVVGYTNAGKTSLIKALTGEEKMKPMDQLFATLDVTAHQGRLPNNMKVLYMDTVGFISDIPTGLIQSFSATLNDMLTADAIIHVNDISHPDQVSQRRNVLETLDNLNLPSSLSSTIIEVANKVDKLPRSEKLPEGSLLISATKGIGHDILRSKLQDVLLQTTGRLRKILKVPMSGQHLRWLYKEATVEEAKADPSNAENLIITAIFTQANWGKFQKQFSSKEKKK